MAASSRPVDERKWLVASEPDAAPGSPAIRPVHVPTGDPLTRLAIAAGGMLLQLGAHEYEKWSHERRQRKLHDLGLVLVPWREAAGEFVFPVGHPLPGALYCVHPLDPIRYLPATMFHAMLFEEKANELMMLLASLGAVRVAVKCEYGYSSKIRGGVGATVPIEGVPVGVDVSAGRSESTSQRIEFEERFDGTATPAVPEGLLWFDHEVSWRAIARRRLELGQLSFNAELRYENDFGVNAAAKVGFAGAGVKFSGELHEFVSTRWRYEGEFAPRASAAPRKPSAASPGPGRVSWNGPCPHCGASDHTLVPPAFARRCNRCKRMFL